MMLHEVSGFSRYAAEHWTRVHCGLLSQHRSEQVLESPILYFVEYCYGLTSMVFRIAHCRKWVGGLEVVHQHLGSVLYMRLKIFACFISRGTPDILDS